MSLSFLKYSHDVLGIRSWVSIPDAAHAETPAIAYFILCEDQETIELKQMLNKIIAALQWPLESCRVEWAVTNFDHATKYSNKSILFSDHALKISRGETAENFLITFSLSRMAKEPDLKREAWQKIKILAEKPA